MFDAQVCVLREHYQITTTDQRGHGLDVSVTEPFSLLDKAISSGMSQGGYVSLRTARCSPKIVLIATHAGVEEQNQETVYLRHLSEWFESSLTNEILQNLHGFILDADQELAGLWIKKRQAIDTRAPSSNLMALANRDDLAPALSNPNILALVVWRDEDSAITIEQARQPETKNVHSPFMEVSGAIHSANMLQENIVDTKIQALLTEALP
ncbi:hypothetical protein AWM79_15855 [Pseudomonas agarici]|uniref:AB hydrolase-1 domain-containing protein n=1 Tax=Pseudomonas agarici TaxID=46677 RepID=A0A0X1T3I1_PSEAA|nr:alpha/beta hydrolase [Pseudomonas agarici]AMB86696.1 hypothetical protein AWM79_15855 [Pseudomonas agarici]